MCVRLRGYEQLVAWYGVIYVDPIWLVNKFYGFYMAAVVGIV